MKVEHIDLDKIKVNERIRTNQEKQKEMAVLKESITVLGLFHPIAVDEDYNLIAGFRRLTAYRELRMKDYDTYRNIPAQVFENVDEYTKLNMELAENEARKNLGSSETKKAKSKLRNLIEKKGNYEVDIEIAKSKEIYQTIHPETIHGANWVGGEKRVLTKEEMVKSGKPDLKKSGDPVKTPSAEIKTTPKPAPQFAKSLAKSMNISETVVKDRAQVGAAILAGKFTEDVVEDYKKGVKSHSKMLQIVREKKTPGLTIIKDDWEPPIVKLDLRESVPIPEPKFCKDCESSMVLFCPHCTEMLLYCLTNGGVYTEFQEACHEFEE